jgi:hypothetical protein
MEPLPLSETAETPKLREVQEGMERGFAMSPMADLTRDYSRHGDSGTSLFMRVTAIVSKKALDIVDVLDRGVNMYDSTMGRFSLETGFLLRTDRTIKEMQNLLLRASSLMGGRSSCFVIDPHLVIMQVLRSANDLSELHAAWLALSERMDLAQ